MWLGLGGQPLRRQVDGMRILDRYLVRECVKVLGLCLTLGLAIGLAFLSIAELAPEWTLGIYSRDPAVVALGAAYLRLFGWSFIFTALTSSYSVILRSVGNVRLPLSAWDSANLNYGSGFLDGDGPFHLPTHTTFDLSLGKTFGESWTVQASGLNLNNNQYLLDNSNTFGGTRILSHGGNVADFSAYMGLIPEQKKGMILLVNADHYGVPPVLAEVGFGATTLLAGQQPAPIRLGFVPWVMRGLALIPLLQIADVVATLRLVRRWRRDPALRPSSNRLWRHILPSLIPNLLAAFLLIPMSSKFRGYLKLYNPDFALIALVCGSFGRIWTSLRTSLIAQTVKKPKASKTA